jgi:hypothetical protein
MARQPDAVDVDNRKNHNRKPDNDADGSQIAGNGYSDGQRHDDFQDAEPGGWLGSKRQKTTFPHREQGEPSPRAGET